MKPNRIGIFYVNLDAVWNTPKLIAEAFAFVGVLPIRAEALADPPVIEYRGWCEQFGEVKEGELPLHYELIVNDDGTGKLRSAYFIAASGMAGVQPASVNGD